MKFIVGELVVKKTGGPAMLVIDNIDLTCQCVYKGTYISEKFSQVDLISLEGWMDKVMAEKKRKAKCYRK